MKIRVDAQMAGTAVLVSVLCIFVFGFQYAEPLIYASWPYEIGSVAAYSLPKLTFQFLVIAGLSCAVSVVLGVGLGIFCFTRIGYMFKPIVEKSSMIIQTIPTMAVLMFGMTAFGVGLEAAVFALVLQSLLPIVFSTMAGLHNVPASYIEVAKGLGMSKAQILLNVRFPLALPVILAGIRVSMIICIGAATLAFSTGAGGLGLLIQTGASTYNTVYIMEGTVPICLIAIIMDRILRQIESRTYRAV